MDEPQTQAEMDKTVQAKKDLYIQATQQVLRSILARDKEAPCLDPSTRMDLEHVAKLGEALDQNDT